MVKLLVENDADVNKPGWTPLHYAATAGNVPIIELLLENSAYIDAESPNGSTPLMMAAMYGSPESVKTLIQAGADLNVKNQLGLTALDFAVRGNRQNSKELIETGLQREAARKARQQALDAPKAEAPKVDAQNNKTAVFLSQRPPNNTALVSYDVYYVKSHGSNKLIKFIKKNRACAQLRGKISPFYSLGEIS